MPNEEFSTDEKKVLKTEEMQNETKQSENCSDFTNLNVDSLFKDLSILFFFMLICFIEIHEVIRSQWVETALRYNSENYLKNLQNSQNFGFNQMWNLFSNLTSPNQSCLNPNFIKIPPLPANGQIPIYMKPNFNGLNLWSNFNA